LADFNIPSDVAEHAQGIFIERRAKEADSGDLVTNQESMHRWLTLSRYLTYLAGTTELTKAIFDEALLLEDTRIERCPVQPAN
jgi:hypothetical protein